MPLIYSKFDFLPKDQKSELGLFARMLLKIWQNACFIWNGGISFGDGSKTDNISGVWVTVTFAVANVDQTVTHNLGRVPVGYLAMTKSAACDVYTGSVAATKTQITLRGTTTSTVVLFIV
jgi:hypothetical protein